jgi:predicted polyphosphate/ATP-dependent NAD kinase
MGFIVNPIAGMGGRVGLKGTDSVIEKAIQMGAKPVASVRAIDFLKKLKELQLEKAIHIITCPNPMGENETKSASLPAKVLKMPLKLETTAEDTKTAVKHMTALKVDLIVFVGGDGTARDILDAMRNIQGLPVLGVPSGVKMYSAIFTVDPSEAAEVVRAFAEETAQITDFEIMDADESAIRSEDRIAVSLYGYLKGPFIPLRLATSKQVSPETLDERENQMAVARFIVEEMDPNGTYILGPGTTVKCIADLLGVDKTVLGVDIYRNKTVIEDVNEERILKEIEDFKNVWIVVSPIGRQGVLLGRGNQQISPKIIKKVGKERIIAVATRSKIQGIEGNVLRVDTGDREVDESLRGYIRVATDYREWRVMHVQ